MNSPSICDNETGPGSAANTTEALTTTANLMEAGALMADAQPTQKCAVDGCETPRRRRQWCGKHYWRWSQYGDPTKLIRKLPAEVRWRRHVAEDEITGCWLWTGHVAKRTGYGSFADKGRSVGAHRYVYEVLVGPVPDGLVLDHLCRVRHCVNPDHLEPVTYRENLIRGESPTALTHRSQVCKRGHSLTGANVHIPPKRPGQRVCVACRTMHRQNWRARKREQALRPVPHKREEVA